MKSKDYIPIDCNFYDELILLAQHRKPIVLMPNPGIDELPLTVKDIVTRSTKEEFLVLSTGDEIRLDRIEALDGNILFLSMLDEEE